MAIGKISKIGSPTIEGFLRTLEDRQGTLDTYRGPLRMWSNWLGDREPSRDLAQEWLDELRTQGKSQNTVSTYANSIRRYFRWRGEAILLDAPNMAYGEAKSRDMTDITKLINACGPCDAAILSLMYDTGCRVSEILRLTLDNVDRERMTITVVRKGRDREEWANITAKGLEYLEHWLKIREGNPKEIFIPYLTESGNPRKAYQAFHYRLRTTAKRLGIEHFTSHMMRHSRATHLLEADVPLRDISQILGHRSIVVTSQIYTRKRPEELAGALKDW